MTKSDYRLDALLRLAEMGRRRAARTLAVAATRERQRSAHASRIAAHADGLRDEILTHATVDESMNIDSHRRSAEYVGHVQGRFARAGRLCAEARHDAGLARNRLAEARRNLVIASRESRLQESLRDAVQARTCAERARRAARQADSDALDAWCSRRNSGDD